MGTSPAQDGQSVAHSIGLRLGALACAQLQLAGQMLAQPGEARHGGIHQARKALRRVRAILALGRGRLGPRRRGLAAQIGRLGRGLSALRDAGALVETIERLKRSEAEIAIVFAASVVAARSRRDALLERELARDPALGRRCTRIAAWHTRLSRLPWAAVRQRTLRKALARSLERVAQAQQRTRAESATDEDWHLLRRRLRRLRQQHSVLEELAPALLKDAPPSDQRAERLGEAQDDALLLARCGARSPFPAALRPTLRQVARRRLAQARSAD